MCKGYIKIPRRIFEEKQWNTKRVYSEFDAFCDIYAMVNARDRTEPDGTKIRRNQASVSLRSLADKWIWCHSKVRRFLLALERKGYIEVDFADKKTVITIIDFGLENQSETPSETLLKHHNTDKHRGLRVVSETPSETQSETPSETLSCAYKNDNINIMSNGENKEEKECISNDIHKKDELSYTPHDEKGSFSLWLKKNYPRVSGMKKPLTLDDFRKLQSAGFNNDAIFSILNDMENWAKLNTKVSAYLTALKWLRKG